MRLRMNLKHKDIPIISIETHRTNSFLQVCLITLKELLLIEFINYRRKENLEVQCHSEFHLKKKPQTDLQ